MSQSTESTELSTARVVADGVKRLELQLREKSSVVFAGIPAGVSQKRLCAMALQAVRDNPELLKCTPQSFLMSVSQAASLGLEIGKGVLSQAYLIPFKDTCTCIIGYRGLIELGLRTGKVLSWDAGIVRDGDEFTYEGGLDPVCKHKPSTDPARSSKPVTHVYFAARLTGGGSVVEVRTKQKIDEHIAKHAKGAGRSDSPWVTSWDAMAKKTLVRAAYQSGKMPLRAEDRDLVLKDDDIIDTTYTMGDE
jgi:recombination protein RecT